MEVDLRSRPMADYSAVLADFTETSFTHDAKTRTVYRLGTGPAVVVIHEIPGLHPGVVEFAQRVVDSGFSVRMPSLFGTPGREVSAGYAMRTLVEACVAREFTAFARANRRKGQVKAKLRRRRARAAS